MHVMAFDTYKLVRAICQSHSPTFPTTPTFPPRHLSVDNC